ncbi:transposase IS4 family protein [Acetonema longum DSM 6540]|uniref:Transposase IS4 family protein n=2 Tax=Acetonema TaxID=2373 RepID=F7NQH3_9FIRM|nr:transposase IS4 family protein [Acetonema longum DSM 6540]
MSVDALGNPLRFLLTGGQVSDFLMAEPLLQGQKLSTVLADKGYDSDKLVAFIEHGGEAIIPWKSSRKHPPPNRKCDWHQYKERHLIECFFNKIKHFRRIATRYDKLASSYLAMLHIVGSLIWLR